MAETLFAFDEGNFRDCQSQFRGAKNQEYYLGDYAIEPGANIDVHAERKTVGPHAIIRLTSHSRLTFRRSRAHIRADGADVTVLWFVKRGRLCVSHQNGSTTAEAGAFVLTRSATPFFIECQTDEASAHEVLHVTLPTHNAREFLSDELATGFSLPAQRRGFAVAEAILANLLDDGDDIAPDTAAVLMRSALTAVGHAIRDSNVSRRLRQTVSDRRLEEVLRFIEVHLANPNLSTGMAAAGCGISPRYLSLLLKHHGTCFSRLVWEQRLEKGRRWLTTTSPAEVSISEVAYSVGFKSPAHFSRIFKQVFKVNPSECRAEPGPRATAQAAVSPLSFSTGR
jgi:AraC-like DNA-binding protein